MERGRKPPTEVCPGADGVQAVPQQEGVSLHQQLRAFHLTQTGGAPGDGGPGGLGYVGSVLLLLRPPRVSPPTPVLPRQPL